MQPFVAWLENIKDIRPYAVIISILLSVLALNTNNPPFEIDGFTYLFGAQEFKLHGLTASIKAYNWPVYQICLALFSKLTHLSHEHSAYLLDSFGITIACFAFISIVQEIDSRKSIVLLSALIFLIFPGINIARKTLILRDYLYWGFCFASLWLIIRHAKYRTWLTAWGFALSSLIATLFRVEGSIFFLLLPLSLILNNTPWKLKLSSLLQCYSFHFLLLAIALVGLLLFPNKITLSESRLTFIISHILQGASLFLHNLNEKAYFLQQHLFIGSEGYHASIATMLFSDIFIIIEKNFLALGVIYSLLVVYAFYSRAIRWKKNYANIIYCFILINLIISFLFVMEKGFLASRYIQVTSIALLFFVPFSIMQIAEQAKKEDTFIKRLKLHPLLIIALILLAINGLYREKYSKAYIVEAGYWLKEHTPSQSKIISNDAKVLYYSKRAGTAGSITQLKVDDSILLKITEQYDLLPSISAENFSFAHGFDYLVLNISRHSEKVEQNVKHLKPLKEFISKRGDKIIIFKLAS